jgi:formylglycine-generating enzyme required for sulfatase activity
MIMHRLEAALLLVICLLVAAALFADPPAKNDPDTVLRAFSEEFILLTPGAGQYPASFIMGSADSAIAKEEKPSHVVRFASAFAVARYEVTQQLYEAVIGRNPSRWKGPRNSVEMVNWSEAVEFCRRATILLQARKLLPANEVIRLPSEAEWEYACRASTTTRYSFGDSVADLKDHAWYRANSKGEDPPVGRKKPNAWGLYDMHGYVWEWCQDAWHPSYDGAPADGSAWESADTNERVLRGGSWADSADACRSAHRHHVSADQRSDTIGFRCVKASAKGK